MFNVLKKISIPNLFIEIGIVGGGFKNHPVLFIWEDTKISHKVNIDVLEITEGATYFSTIKESMKDFNSDVKFSIVCANTYKLLFSENFINLNFITGKNILFVSQNSYTGYSYASRNYMYQLLKNGYNVKWEVIGDSTYKYFRNEELNVKKSLYTELDKIDNVIVHHTPDIFHTYIKKYPNCRVSGLTTWESDVTPESWSKCINELDNLIVPSMFNKESFEKNHTDIPIHVWRHEIFDFIKTDSFDKDSFYDKCELICGPSSSIKNTIENNVVYYNISEFTPRKNLEQVIHCFLKRFDSDDNVCLFLKVSINMNHGEEYIKYKIMNTVNQYKNKPNIVCCFSSNLTDIEIQYIHEIGDVYFTLNRGEGFGLSTYAAKKIGNKIICGKFGAEREFLNENEDVLLDYKMENNNYKIQSKLYNNIKIPIYKTNDVINVMDISEKIEKTRYIL